jgi:hypothetical protein
MLTIDVIARSDEPHANAVKRMQGRELFGKIIVGS